MSGQKKKGLTLARKQNLTGWVFLAPATLLIRMDELLSHDPGVHLIAADRNGY